MREALLLSTHRICCSIEIRQTIILVHFCFLKNKWLIYVQLNFDGSNIFGTIENCPRHGWFEPLRVNYGANQEANGDNIGIFFDFLHNNCLLSVLIRFTSMRRF